jgi:site-specific DNA recombinase
MADPKFFKLAFDDLAIDGALGDPNGQPAYAYIRVSSDEQAEEGRSGLPRQLIHIHEIAREKGLRVSWDCVFAEDFSGFVLERPELSQLLKTLRTPNRQANVVVIEHLDRLSRNADWHQGYLMEQLEKHLNVRIIFWKQFTSRIERAVMGAVAQEGMELAKARMAEGIVNKALTGRVTSRKRAYGYKFVDEHGREGERARKFTHYAIREDEAMIVRAIFQRVCSGETLYKILIDFTDRNIKPPGKYKAWDTTFLRLLIQNPVYKGEYVANRTYTGEVQKPTKDGLSICTVKKTMYRPEEEWIRVPVPPIVHAETWQRANDMLQKSRQMATRNAKHDYLLNGLLRCAECGFVYSGTRLKENLKGGRYTDYFGYCCSTKSHYTRKKVGGVTCSQGYISCRKLDTAVWSVVCDLLLRPETLIAALESNLRGERNDQVNRQIGYLERELEHKKTEDEKLYRAYMADVFDELEYKDRRGQIRADMERMRQELDFLRPRHMTQQQFETQKAELLAMSERLRDTDTLLDPPFELKRRILKMTVDAIHVNQREGWFTLTGSIQSHFQFESASA